MNAAGYPQTDNGNGSGTPHNFVKRSDLYNRCCSEIEADHPRVARERVFESVDAFMVICDVEEDARYISGATYIIETPDDFSPRLTFYFTYASRQIVMQAVYADA